MHQRTYNKIKDKCVMWNNKSIISQVSIREKLLFANTFQKFDFFI